MKAKAAARRPASGTRDAPHASPWKARAVVGLVALVALWPLAHRVLVAWLDFNPWKLGGFAMYTTATPPLVIDLFGLAAGRVLVLDPASLPIQARLEHERFGRARHALGELARPAELAALLLQARPELSQVAVLVRRFSLDPATARVVEERTQYTYDRGGPREGRRTTPGRPTQG